MHPGAPRCTLMHPDAPACTRFEPWLRLYQSYPAEPRKTCRNAGFFMLFGPKMQDLGVSSCIFSTSLSV